MSTETNTDLPDTSDWVKRAPGDVIEAGTPYVGYMLDGFQLIQLQHHAGRLVNPGERIWTPPPAPSEPWSALSSEPKLARVVYTIDDADRVFEGRAFIEGDSVKCWDGESGLFITWLHNVHLVELLHTHNPETHVPVERALIDEAVQWLEGEEEGRTTAEIMADLASLASDESNASDGGRS